jgi:hypothetical protein
MGLTVETRMGCKPARAIHLAICLQSEALWDQETVLVPHHRDGAGTHTPYWTGLAGPGGPSFRVVGNTQPRNLLGYTNVKLEQPSS